jgi:hypothetical protein
VNFAIAILFWLSLAALFATKAADVASTIRYVGSEGESNPLARSWFGRFGFTGGLVLVCVIHVLIAGGQYALVWSFGGAFSRAANALVGFGIAWAQWDVACVNAGLPHSWFTQFALRAYSAWGRWTRRR